MNTLKRANKVFSILTSFVMLVQPLIPAFQTIAPQVFAQAETPVPTDTVTPTDTISPTPTQEVSPAPTETITPVVTPEATSTPTPMDQVTPTVTPDIAPSSTPNGSANQPTGPPAEDGQILDGASVTPTPTVTPEQPETGELQAIVLEHVQAVSLDLGTVDPSSATLTTDKGDYAPTDTALITGSAFTPGDTYTLVITSQDPPAVHFEAQITAEPNGTFVYAYQLDGNYRPNYRVEAKELDGTNVDVITFTDSVTPLPNPTLGQACGLDIALVMDNSQSITTAQRTQMKSALIAFTSALSGTPTQFSVTRFGNSASLIQGFTSNIASVNTAINSMPADPTGEYTNWEAGLQTAGASFAGGTANPNLVIFATDGDPTASSAGPNDTGQPNIHLDPAIVQANSIKTGGTRMLALGIGSPTLSRLEAISGPTVGTNLSADVITTDFNSLATALATFASQTCGGTISIHKVVTGEQNPTLSGWHFTVNGQDYATDAQGNTQAIPVTPGTYSAVEVPQGAYTLASYACTKNNNPIGSPMLNGVDDLLVGANDIVSCTFTNSKNPATGTIVVHKDVQGPNGENITDAANFQVSLDGGPDQAISDNLTVTYPNVSVGSHTVTEPSIGSNYTLYGISSTVGGSGNLGGLTINVTTGTNDVYVTNRQKSGTINIVKVGNGSNTQDFGFNTTGLITDETSSPDFLLDDDSNGTLSNTKTFTGVAAGTYGVSEVATAGWTLDSIVCVDPTPNSTVALSTATINLAAGETVTCTFTNTLNTGSIKVNKKVDANGDGDYLDTGEGVNGTASTPFTWTYGVIGPNVMGATQSSLTSGTGSLSENTVTNYHLVGWYRNSGQGSCANPDSTTLPASVDILTNQTVEITICNAINGGTIKITKDLITPNDPGLFNLLIDGTPHATNVGNLGNTGIIPVSVGQHTMSETAGTSTSMDNYNSSISCFINGQPGGSFDNGVVTVSAGQNYNCFISNGRKQSLVSVSKQVDNNGDGDWDDTGEGVNGTASNPFTWSLNLGSPNAMGATVTFPYTHNGAVSVTENTVAGYHFVGWYDPNAQGGFSCFTPFSTQPFSYTEAGPNGSNKNIVLCNALDRGNIVGTKFNDHNGNGLRDQGDELLSSWGFDLKNQSDVIVQQVASDDNGFTFTNVPIGNYTVCEQPKVGWTQTYPFGCWGGNIRCKWPSARQRRFR